MGLAIWMINKIVFLSQSFMIPYAKQFLNDKIYENNLLTSITKKDLKLVGIILKGTSCVLIANFYF